jgi:hypothetical protein
MIACISSVKAGCFAKSSKLRTFRSGQLLRRRRELEVSSAFRAKRHAMKAHHVSVHAAAVNRMAADLAGHIAGRVRNRLLQQGWSS